MKNSPPALPPVSLNIQRRRQIATAATAAALSLAGCNMFHPPVAATSTPEQLEAERRVKAYQNDIESALDKVDRERLRAAAEKKTSAAVAASPAAAPSVIFASAEPAGTPAAAPKTSALPHAAAAPTVAAVAPAASPAPSVAAPAPSAAPKSTPAAMAAAPAEPPVSPASPTASAASAAAPDVAPALPLSSPAALNGVVVAPLSGDATVSSAVIAPFTPPATPNASAMGAMTAMVTPGQALTADPTASPSAPAEASLDDAMNVLRKSIAEHPTLNTALAMALLDGDKPGDAFKKLPEADQKLASDLLAALDAMKSRASAPTLADRAAPLLDAASEWRGTADLTLPRLVLATRVDSFGVFTPITGTFEQGKRHTVIIYCEVANFRSTKGDDGWYTTKLAQQETLFTEDGLLVWRPNAEDVEDRSLNQRHDFYLVKKLTIPETLAAGKYTLRMSVTDRTANKIKIVEMPIEIVTK